MVNQPFVASDLGDQRQKLAGHCPNCGHDSAFTLIYRYTIWPTWDGGVAPETYPRADASLWQCLFCDQTTNAVTFFAAVEADVEVLYAWPRFLPQELDATVPEVIRGLFLEGALSANAGALRAAAGAFRAAVEAIARDKGAPGGDLRARIDALSSMGVHPDIVRDLHEVRLTGNWSMHEGTEFAEVEIDDVADLIMQACYALYVAPARRDAMRRARQERRTRGTTT